MDDDSYKNLVAISMRMYDACQPLRDLIKEYPEYRDDIVKELGKALTQELAGNFYGPQEGYNGSKT